jgi:hypothetical protein
MGQPATKSQRLNIGFTDEALEDIKKLADQSGMSMSEFVRNSVRVYGALKRETRNSDKKILIGTNNGVDKEIIIP